jgi:deferrochelatase/peroxidase EfeB
MQLSRRRLLTLAGAGAVGAGVGLGAEAAVRATADDGAAVSDIVEFHGRHQAGIVTAAQDRLHIAAFDVITDDRDQLVDLLRRWTDAAAAMTQGRDVGEYGAVGGPLVAPPEDTGEALDLSPARLTITFGFGPGLFTDAGGLDRFGIADRRPEALRDLPHFPGDALDPARSGGDLCVQACADDPQVAVHAVRNLARLAFGVASVRWSQLGFGRTSSTTTAQRTPRNLFGFKDGTANLTADDQASLDQHVWVRDEPSWMVDGSYMVCRRINMHIETWDRTSLGEQEAVIGRSKGAGAPLSGGEEHTEPDFDIVGTDGAPLVPLNSHVRLAHPSMNDGHAMLRRGYNFTDGTDGVGRLDAGLFFIAFVADPWTQYVPMQTVLARDDALSEYLQHRGSALFAVPPGVREPGGYVGSGLFEP